MPSTSIYGLRYPSPDDQAGQGPAQIQALAEDAEEMLAGLITDTGVLNNLDITPGAGFTTTQSQYRVIGKMMFVFLWMERTGANITISAAGNIDGDPTLATINDATDRPAFTAYGTFLSDDCAGQYQIDTQTGEIQLVSGHTNGVINTGESVRIHAKYPLV